MTPQEREVMQMALDALDSKHDMTKAEWRVLQYRAFTAVRAALAQPEQEPVAWMHIQGDHEDPCFRELTEDEISRGWTQKPLYYTAPPQREWQGLTDEEYESMAEKHVTNYFFDTLKYARAIETKLRVKNGNI